MELMPGYRQTEVGVIPEDWITRTCSAVSSLITVGIVIRPTQYYVTQGVPAFRSANIREDGIDDSDLVFISEKSNMQLVKSQVKKGDVLTVRTGYPGTSAVVPAVFAGSNCIDILITRPSKELNPYYLTAWINSPFGKQQVLRDQGGLAQQHFNVGDLRNLVIALPSTKTEQDAIAEALCDADALIKSLDQLIVKKRNLKQGVMQELLLRPKDGWLATKMASLGIFLKGSGVKKDESRSGELPCIRYGEIYTKHNDYVKEFNSWISPEVAATARRLKTGDVLFAGSGETKAEIGKCVAFVEDLEAYAGGDIVILRPENANSMFLGYYLNTAPINRQKASKGQGDAIVHIGSSALSDIDVMLPTVAEQAAIATILSDTDAEITALESKLTKTRHLKQGMMQNLLTGKIRLV